MNDLSKISVVLPSLDPDEKLIAVVDGLLEYGFSDIILVNYNRASIGTSMEVFYAAHDQGKFVVAFSPLEYKDCSPWMARFCTKILPTLEDAVDYIITHFDE